MLRLEETFRDHELDRDVWFPHYLPHWSSRDESKATYQTGSDGLRLSIPPDQALWCPDLHEEPLRVSCIQSGSFSGPIGSTVGQQPFMEGLEVREEQPAFWGFTPTYGTIGIEMKGNVDAGSMFAFWLSGIEDSPRHSAEICVAEIFGSGIDDFGADVGFGVHAFRDPSVAEEFNVGHFEIDVSGFHVYEVNWTPELIRFSIDGVQLGSVAELVGYPMQLMIGVFDFPDRWQRNSSAPIPEMYVSKVWAHPEV